MALSIEEVRRVAVLARLSLGTDAHGRSEEELFAQQLGAVLSHVEQLRELKLDGVAPTTHPTAVAETSGHAMRADVVRPSLPAAVAVAGAPEKSGTSFVVPRSID